MKEHAHANVTFGISKCHATTTSFEGQTIKCQGQTIVFAMP